MKKKKLSIERQTLRDLQTLALANHVHGGGFTQSCNSPCHSFELPCESDGCSLRCSTDLLPEGSCWGCDAQGPG